MVWHMTKHTGTMRTTPSIQPKKILPLVGCSSLVIVHCVPCMFKGSRQEYHVHSNSQAHVDSVTDFYCFECDTTLSPWTPSHPESSSHKERAQLMIEMGI